MPLHGDDPADRPAFRDPDKLSRWCAPSCASLALTNASLHHQLHSRACLALTSNRVADRPDHPARQAAGLRDGGAGDAGGTDARRTVRSFFSRWLTQQHERDSRKPRRADCRDHCAGQVRAARRPELAARIYVRRCRRCELTNQPLELAARSRHGPGSRSPTLLTSQCFFAGGLRYSELGFKPAGAQVNSSLLIIAVVAILLPAGFNATFR